METPTTGKKVETVLSSKFCTGRHLQLFTETLKLLEDVEDEENAGGAAKKRKVEKTGKSYQAKCKKMADYVEDVKQLKKLCKIFPDIQDNSQVLFLSPSTPTHAKNMLNEECKTENQINLIGTIIEAVSSLKPGQHLLVQGFPLHTRLTTTLFYCLAALFEEVGFVRPYLQDDFIFLSKFLGGVKTADQVISSLEQVLTVLMGHKGSGQVMSVWPVQDLVQDKIYQEIILYNQTRIKEQLLYLTDFLEPNKEEVEEKS